MEEVIQQNVNINFSTNAKQVEAQIKSLNHQVSSAETAAARLENALRNNRATSKSLTGDIRAKTAIVKLDKQIGKLADDRVRRATAGYAFESKAQKSYVQGLMKTNEVLRIQHGIMRANADAMINMGKNTQWAGRQLVVGFTVPLTIAAGAAMKAFSNLEKELVRFKRVYGDAFTSNEDVKEASENVKKLAMEWAKFGVAVSDTIDLAAEAAGAGFTGNQLTAQINAASKLAVLGELDKQKAMKATIAVQSTFKQSNDELGQSINFLNQLENQTMVTMNDMVVAIPKAATVVQGLGGTIQDLGVFMAAMAEGGVTAAEGANALKSGLGSLLNPSKKAKEELAKIGVILPELWKASEENGRGVIYVVEEMSKAMDRLGQTQKQMVIEELFGKHQFARMNALLDNINRGTQALQAKDVAGTGQLEAALISQRELGKLGESNLTKFQAAIEKLKASVAPLGETIMGAITPLINGITKVVDWFNKMPEAFQKIGLGMVAAIGVVVPVGLMLLGQIQNLVGNGMKFIVMLKGWGKQAKWVNIENLTIADSLGKVDANLIAQNQLLLKNEALWRSRGAAATASAVAGGVGGKPPIRRNSGGPIPGSGNGDTVPAMLTPGEFVVNKKATERFSGLLRAINSGTLQGFATGGMVHPRAQVAMDSTEGLNPAQTKAVKAAAHAKLMQFKAKEGAFVKRIYNNAVAKYSDLNFASVGNWLQWDQSHIGRADSNKIINTKTGEKAKRWNYRGDLILDNHMININVPSVQAHPTTVPEVPPLEGMISNKLKKSAINPNHIITKKLLDWRKKGGGKAFYDEYIDENFVFMNLLGGKKGASNTVKSGYGKNYRVNAGKEIRGVMYANSGYVPGTGNQDTVPAMLTPGEAVINKKASKKFGPLLNAINNGTIKMLAGGSVPRDKGYSGPLGTDARKALLDPLRAAVDSLLQELISALNLSKDEVKRTKAVLQQDLKEQTRAAHIVPMRDENGKKIYNDQNLVGSTRRENQAMDDLYKKQGQAIFRQIAATEKDTVKQAQRTAVMDKLARQEHIVLKEERKLLQEMMVEAQQLKKSNPDLYNQLPKSLRGSRGRAVAVGLGSELNMFSTGAPVTQSDYATAVAMGTGATRGAAAGEAGSIAGVNKGKKFRMDPYAISMLFMMFGGELSGLTEKMGAFGKAISAAIPALMTMQMMGVGPSGISKGIGAAAGKVGLAGKFAKYGLKAGGIGGLVGGIGGSLIGDKVGGGAGAAIKWGATGAGLGMMFGPWGAAIGGAVGALAGWTSELISSSKEMKKATEAMENSAAAYTKIGDQLKEKYQVGTNVSMSDMIAGVVNMTDEQAQLFQQLKDDMAGEGAWADRIANLELAYNKGTYGGAQNELDALTMELRGRGVDEQSIETILKAFLDSLPDKLRDGLVGANLKAQGTSDIVNGLNSNSATMLPTVIQSLTTSLNNAEVGSKEYLETQEQLAIATKKSTQIQNELGNSAAFKRMVGSGVNDLIKSGEGNGLTEEQWLSIQNGFTGNQAELSVAAQMLMQAGVDISTMAGAQIMALGALNVELANMTAQKAEADAQIARIDKDRADLKNIRSARAKELEDNAGAIARDEAQRGRTIQDATLEIARINIEKSTLADFVGKFNKAFGTSIDSFADAQYQIDKIGNRIERIRIKQIAPLQEKIDDLNRANELASRELEKIDEQREERTKKINDAYDKQLDALKKIREQNDFIFAQQKNSVSMADALAKGDVAGAVQAMVESNQNVANYTGTFAEQALQDQKDAALANDPFAKKEEELNAAIEARKARILALEDRIYNINENQIEPLQRRSDLMGLMLSTTKLEMEYRKANAKGIDEENHARTRALQAQKDIIYNAENEETLRQSIVNKYKDQIAAIKDTYAAEQKGAETVGETMDRLYAKAAAQRSEAASSIDYLQKGAEAMASSYEEGVKYFSENKVMAGSTAAVSQEILRYLEQAGEYKPADKPKPSSSTSNAGTQYTPSDYLRNSAFGGKGAFGGAGASANPNFLGVFGDAAIQKLVENPAIADKMAEQASKAQATAAQKSSGITSQSDPTSGKVSGAGVNKWTGGKGYAGAKWYQKGNWTWAGGHHNGIDVVGVGSGTRVTATRAGRIVHSGFGGPEGGWAGNNVIQDIGGGARLVFAHLSKSSAAGSIGRGGTIGYTGNTGRSFGAHLHVSAVKGGTYVNPTQFLNSGGSVMGVGNYDKVPAMLTPGEFVLNKAAVSTIGTAPLKALNSGKLRTGSVAVASSGGESGGPVVYNEYNLSFDISEASDANEVANLVLTKIDRATRSRVRK